MPRAAGPAPWAPCRGGSNGPYDNELGETPTGSCCSFCLSRCILVPPMNSSVKDFWVFRIVHQDTGKPAQGVPVTVLDASSNPAGYWVSEADGTVSIPRREGARLRLRVGLRNE